MRLKTHREGVTEVDLTRGWLSLLVSEAARGSELAWEMLRALGVGRYDAPQS